jgi:hypothetical protein
MSILDIPKIAQLNFQDDASNQMAGIMIYTEFDDSFIIYFFFVSLHFQE